MVMKASQAHDFSLLTPGPLGELVHAALSAGEGVGQQAAAGPGCATSTPSSVAETQAGSTLQTPLLRCTGGEAGHDCRHTPDPVA